MKRTIAVLTVLLPALSFADNAAATKSHVKAHKASVAKAMEINLTGGTDANRMEIEKVAKEAGAEQASFDAKTGVLKVTPGKAYSQEKFSASLGKIPGVSLKQ